MALLSSDQPAAASGATDPATKARGSDRARHSSFHGQLVLGVGGVLVFRKQRPWSWRQLSELSQPGMLSDNGSQQVESVHGVGKSRCLRGRTVKKARSIPHEQARVCPASTSTSFTGNRRMVIGSRSQSTCEQYRPSKRSGPCSRPLTLSRIGYVQHDLCGCRG